MELFYYGIWLFELVSIITMLVVYKSNRGVLKDLQQIPKVKNRWLQAYLQEFQRDTQNHITIHNPSVYMARRLRERKIGKISVRMLKGFSWTAFVLSFFVSAVGVWQVRGTGIMTLSFPFVKSFMPAMEGLIGTTVVLGAVNGMLRLIFSIAYQEEMIETNLLDYMENEKDSAGRIVKIEPPIANEAKKAAAKKMSRKARSKARQQEQKLREELLRAQKERARNGGRESPSAVRSQQQKMEQVEARIREAALTDERYRHLLDEEEEMIVKDVIKEFLS